MTLAGANPRHALLVGLIAAGLACASDRDEAAERARAAALDREASTARFQVAIQVEPCLLESILAHAAFRAMLPETWTAELAERTAMIGARLSPNCILGIDPTPLVGVVPQAAIDALTRWRAAQVALTDAARPLARYFGDRAWREDQFAALPGLLAALEPVIASRGRALADVRVHALPPLRLRLGAAQAQHLARHGQDATWWRVRLGLGLWDLGRDAIAAAMGAEGGAVDVARGLTAIREATAAWLAEVAQAPAEVRAQVRRMAWLTDAIVAGATPPPDALWHLTHREQCLLRNLTEVPGLRAAGTVQ